MFFHPINILVFVTYFLFILIIGVFSGRKERDTDDYFLGGRNVPWLAVCLSILATECSAVTFIGAPAIAFAKNGNFTYIQLAIGSLIGRFLIAKLFLRLFYKHKVTTVYGFLRIRFGSVSQILGALFFFVTRLLASGVRLLVASLALHVVFQIPLFAAIMLSAGIAALYTVWGGIKAVIWTDVMQIIIFMGGAVVALVLLYNYCGGYDQIMSYTKIPNKWMAFDLSLDLRREFTLLAGIVGGCFLTLASLGTDQDLTQRMLTCRDTKSAQKALILTGILDFPVVIIFLSIGVLLYVFFQINPDPNLPVKGDHIFPYFILKNLPPGLSGLLIMGVFSAAMSSLDSALNALSSSAMCDIYKPFIAKNRSEKHYLLVSRIMVVSFAVVLVGVAYLCKNMESVLVLSFKITSFTYGALLGVFLIATLTKKGSDLGNIIAMFTSIPVVYIFSLTSVAWPFYIVVGSLWTFFVGVICPVKNFKFNISGQLS